MTTGKKQNSPGARHRLLMLGVVAAYFFSRLDGLVEGLIETEGSSVAGSAVEVTGLHIDLRAGSATIEMLSIASPEPFVSQPAITLTDFLIRINTSSVTENPVVIEEVSVASADFKVEQSSKGNNLKALQSNVQNSPSSQRSANTASDSNERKLIIKKFTIEAMNAVVSIPEIGEARKVSVPSISLANIGSASNGATASELAQQVLAPILRKAMQSVAVENVKGKVKERFEEEKNKFLKGLLEKAK